MLRFTRQLASGLEASEIEVTTWAPEPRFTRFLPSYRYSGGAKYLGYLDKFVVFPREIKRRWRAAPGVDLVHIIDHANAVYAPLFAGTPLLATCHDLLQIRAARGEFREHRVAGMGRRYQAWIARHIAALPHVATPSTETARDLRRIMKFPASRITVIPNGLNFPYSPLSATTAGQIIAALLAERGFRPRSLREDRPFVLNVGGGQWYKNRRGLLEIYAALRPRLQPAPRLVMVGKPLSAELRELSDVLGVSDDVVGLTGVSETELQALYSAAEALIFPSWHEGFGWPVAEAQACGCPVFTSQREPMTEVGGDAACYFDPANPLAAANTIAAAWPRRPELAARGRERAAEWTPSLMIDRYLAAYAQVIAQPQPVAA